MKKFVTFLVALFALPFAVTAQTTSYAQAGVSFFTGVTATATQTLGPVKLPTFSGTGVLTITESGITGSPSGCTVTLKYQGNNAATAGAVVSTTSFTPATGVQSFSITPSILTGDAYVATYACSSTYPTAGLITASFSPQVASSGDPCLVSPKSSIAVNISSATTTQLVALAAGKKVYACGFTATIGASTTVAFEYGTGSACGTGTTVLTGPFTFSTIVGSQLSLSAAGSEFSTITSNALCALSTGSGGIAGVLTYVQQ